MGGDIGRITPEFRAVMEKVAREDRERILLAKMAAVRAAEGCEPLPEGEHSEWRRLNLGTDR